MNWIHRPLWNRNMLLFSSFLVGLIQFIYVCINPIPFAATTELNLLSTWSLPRFSEPSDTSVLPGFSPCNVVSYVVVSTFLFTKEKFTCCSSITRKDKSMPQQWGHKQTLPLLSVLSFEVQVSVFCSWPFPKLWCWTRPHKQPLIIFSHKDLKSQHCCVIICVTLGIAAWGVLM